MLKVLGYIIWFFAFGIWLCWPGRAPITIPWEAGMYVLLVGLALFSAGMAIQMSKLQERQQRTENFLDELAQAWIDHDPDGGEPVEVPENVVKLIRRKA